MTRSVDRYPAEQGERRNWLPAPAVGAPVSIGDAGVAEIKPRTASGIAAGMAQLRSRTGPGTRVLITYLPVDASGAPVRFGKAAAVDVHAITVGASDFATAALMRSGPVGRAWSYLGRVPVPAQIPFPSVQQGGFFGAAVEPLVRRRFARTAVRTAGRTWTRGTGGSRPGPDAGWSELAEFYSELSRLTRDPFVAELGSALSRV